MRISGPPRSSLKPFTQRLHCETTRDGGSRLGENGARRSPGASKPCRAHHHQGRRPRLLPQPRTLADRMAHGGHSACAAADARTQVRARRTRAQGHDRTWRGWCRNAVTVRRAPSTWPHDGVVRPWKRQLSDDERSVLLSELLLRHPELVAEAEEITSTLLVVENDQKLAGEITARLRALRPSGPVSVDSGRGRVL